VESYGTSDRWLDLLREATANFDLGGITMRWWMKNPASRASFLPKAESGCKVRILIMHEDNPMLRQYVNQQVTPGGLVQVAGEIRAAFSQFSELSLAHPNIEVRQIRAGSIQQQLNRNDDRMIVVPMLYSRSLGHSPMMECPAQSVFYRAMLEEFDLLWRLNSPPMASEKS
jgi:hypothetical protein